MVGALAALLSLLLAGSARACSCAPVKPGEAMREADAAVVGRLVAVVPRGAMWADYRYRVRRVYKRSRGLARGRTISVRSARQGAACALPRRRGRRYGLFLTRDRGRWRSGSCAVVSPRRLRAAARQGRRAGRAGDSGCAGEAA
jgi:hypothetical protein